MADELDRVAEETGIGRRAFLRRMLIGTAFATPVVASFAMGGVASAAPHGGSPIAPLLPWCQANQTETLIANTNQNGGEYSFFEEFEQFAESLCGNNKSLVPPKL
ncbi:MAG: hypothetical protein ABSD82_06705 [Solirubrobacteraceae bacterium]|jgi:hypothetical protein